MQIDGVNMKADEGKTFRRIHDGKIMGNGIQLGVEYSTGELREDKVEYYEEIDIPKEEIN
jgi:hypothetical protein